MKLQLMDKEFEIITNTGNKTGIPTIIIKHKDKKVSIIHNAPHDVALDIFSETYPDLSDEVRELLVEVVDGLGFIKKAQ